MLLHLLNLFIKIGRILYYLFFYFCFSKKSLLLYFSKVELLCELGENLKTDPSPQGEKCQHTVAIPQKSTIYVCACALSCLTLCDPVDCLSCSRQTPLSMEFSRQEYWSGLPFPTPGDLSHPGIEPMSVASPALAGRFFPSVPPRKPLHNI